MSVGPESARDINEIAKKGSVAPKVIGFFVVLAAGVGTLLWFTDKRDQEKRREAVHTAWSRLSTCVVGEPLAKDEKASVRFRRIQIAVAEEEPTKLPGGASEAWPERCAKYVNELQTKAADGGPMKASAEALAQKAVDLKKLLVANTREARLADVSGPIDEVWKSAEAGGWAASRASDVVAAPEAAKPKLAFTDFASHKPLSTAQVPVKSMKREVHRHRDLAFTVVDATVGPEPLLCVVPDEVGDVECRKLSKEVVAMGSEPRLIEPREDGAAPLLAFGDLASGGILRSDTSAAVLKDEKFGWGYVRKDGVAFSVAYHNDEKDKKKLFATRLAAGAGGGKDAPVTSVIELPGKVASENLYYALGVAPGFLLSRGLDTHGELRLFAQPFLPTGAEVVGPAVEVGAIESWTNVGDNDFFASCSSKGAVTALVRDEYSWKVATLPAPGGKWTTPATLSYFEGFSCNGGEIGLTSSAKGGVRVTRCSAGACQSDEAKLPEGDRRSSAWLDGVVATIDRTTDRGGVRLRVADPRAIATTGAQVIFDDWADASGVQTTRWLSDFQLFPVGATALLVVVTPKGTWLARVDRAGNVKPLDVVIK
jgi:hypothetical protein